MVDHSENKPLENKTQGQEKAAPSSLVFQDEDENIPDFDRTINLGTPIISSSDNHAFDSTIQFSNMEPLFEEESAKPAPETDKADTHTVSEPEKPDDEAYDLGIDTDELEGLKDFMVEDDDGEDEPTVVLADMPDEDGEPSDIHNVMGAAAKQSGSPDDNLNDESIPPTAPAKKIELTEADYADTASPETLSAKGSATPPSTQLRTSLATVLGLIGIIAASGALWMIFDLSNRMDQLTSQLAVIQNNEVNLDQRRDITPLNQRIDKLSTQLAAHLKTIAQAKTAPPASDVKKSSVPVPVATKPTVTAIKPAMDSGHGPWVVNLTSLSRAVTANNEVTRLKALGIRAESIKVMTQGKTWYRIRVPGFASAEEADRQRKILGNRLGIHDTWIGKR
ncbi:MAG: SPOR domain-containing protein [Mariprofundaceae bacterium]|nr:SPOR domain-containing protein [Mariprofundaceae bacterium]